MAVRAHARTVAEVCADARRASRRLGALDREVKDAALHAIADALLAHTAEVLEANAADLDAGRDAGLATALLDRLTLTPERVRAMADGLRDVAALPDPVGEILDGGRLPGGLDLQRSRIPLGVVAVVYEARPNVTIDAAGLCLKSGNAAVLRGSSTAAHSNAVLARISAEAGEAAGLPEHALQLVSGGGREELAQLATQDDTVDLIVPRGGEGLKKALRGVATVPVIFAASGVCHVYVDRSADLDAAVAITVNAKVQRPGVCNAAETLLVHRDVADAFLPAVGRALAAEGVLLRADAEAAAHLEGTGARVEPAVDEDWGTEYLDLVLSVGVVDDVHAAVDHVEEHGSGHSDAILASDAGAIRAFERGVGSAAVYVNASTRFTDGAMFGMGAEIGISTQKLHARGPLGLRELTTYRYLVRGDGHVRP